MVLEGRLWNINSWRQNRSELIFASALQHHALISDKTQVRKKYFDSNMIQKGNATLSRHFSKDYFAVHVDRSKCLHATSSKTLFCTHYVGNMIYHKFSHDDVYIRFHAENVNIMLGFSIIWMKLNISRSMNKTNKMTCPPSLIRVFAVHMKKHWALNYLFSAQWRLWSDWADAQADLSLHWAHMSFCWFSHMAVHIRL